MADFLPALETLCDCLGIDRAALMGNRRIEIDAAALRLLITSALETMPIDTARYAAENADLANAFGNDARSLQRHFAFHGYFEGRPWLAANFDSDYYLEHNPDVAKAYLNGAIASPADHFQSTGLRELRAPSPETQRIAGEWARVRQLVAS